MVRECEPFTQSKDPYHAGAVRALKGILTRLQSPSREATKERSPRRKPWEVEPKINKPRRAEKKNSAANEPVTPTATPSRPATTPAALGWSRLPAYYAIPATAPTLAEAREYCARLARSHYENFSVASWFLPGRLRQHFFNVYAYCRISDDLGDEVGDTAASLELLDEWQLELDACYNGSPKHPVFVALAETVRQFDIPEHEFSDLLIAFRRDQSITRFETFNDVLTYCKYSANPVGHLVLYLCGYRDPERQQLSDFTCTALQLANFWQDVTADYAKGRIYLPLEDLRQFQIREDEIAHNQNTPAFCSMMKFEVERARDWFRQGLPLISKVNPELAIDLDLFSRGGQEILNAIEKQHYAVLGNRPSISKPRKLALVTRAALGKLFSNFSSADSRRSTQIDQVRTEQNKDQNDKGLSA